MGQRYVIREAKTKEELDEITNVIWAANYTPYEPFMQLFFPVLGYTTAHREAAIAESKQRIWTQHQADNASHWFYAFDTVTKKTVGCSQWVISTSNPFVAGIPKLTAPWWPEGEHRRFCESILNQVMGKPLYDKFGFQSLLKVAFDNEDSEASDEWRKCAHEMTPAPIFAMWRPKKSNGATSQGGFSLPWALGTQ
ncbi:unnamed protein product [Alternaria sp. RS040]